MCTAVSFSARNHYFGRNLDLEFHYNESVVITPRNYVFRFVDARTLRSHYAMIGIATVVNDYPLYYDATNEMGLSMAALNFPGNAVYRSPASCRDNITPFECIPWILSQCKSVDEAIPLLERINITDVPFSADYPLTPLHWIISDHHKSVVLESMKDGIKLHENKIGVLTNNPPFDYHMVNLSNYLNVTAGVPENRFSNQLDIKPYSRGMGGIGLPGDVSSSSRFIRATFTKWNSVCEDTEVSAVSQFFHILESVAQYRGCVRFDGHYEITVYSSCCNTDTGTYYYKTYDNSQITAVSLKKVSITGSNLICYPLRNQSNIYLEKQ